MKNLKVHIERYWYNSKTNKNNKNASFISIKTSMLSMQIPLHLLKMLLFFLNVKYLVCLINCYKNAHNPLLRAVRSICG